MKLPGSDVGGGWWIFDLPEGDLGFHPVDDPKDAGTHDVSLYCDDIHGTVRDMKKRGVRFTADVADHGYGLVTYFQAPGGIKIQLYEPRYVKGGARARPAASNAKRTAAKTKTSRAPAAKRKGSTKRASASRSSKR